MIRWRAGRVVRAPAGLDRPRGPPRPVPEEARPSPHRTAPRHRSAPVPTPRYGGTPRRRRVPPPAFRQVVRPVRRLAHLACGDRGAARARV